MTHCLNCTHCGASLPLDRIDHQRETSTEIEGELEADGKLGDWVFTPDDCIRASANGRLLEVVDLAARSTRLEVTLPWYLKIEKFYGEVVSTNADDVRPQHLAPNDAMLFFQTLSACSGATIYGDDRIRIRATWETPFSKQAKEQVIDTTLNALAGDDDELTKAAAIAGYAEALIQIADGTANTDRAALIDEALAAANAAKDAAIDPDLIEIRQLLTLYR